MQDRGEYWLHGVPRDVEVGVEGAAVPLDRVGRVGGVRAVVEHAARVVWRGEEDAERVTRGALCDEREELRRRTRFVDRAA